VIVPGAERADALLEAEQALVDLSAVEPIILVVALRLGGPLRASKVDERELASLDAVLPRLRRRLAHCNLQDGVRARGDLVLRGGARSTLRACHEREHRVGRGQLNPREPHHALLPSLILHHLMKEVIRGHQRQSEVIIGNQRQSEAIRGNQRQSEDRSSSIT
jgi:hypothetical protein